MSAVPGRWRSRSSSGCDATCPGIYWLAVVLISIVGTLITDNLTDNFGVSLVTTTIVFSVALAATFAAWYASERTLSIHTIVTTRREAFYWLAVLFTFALGTAAGDLMAERLAVGYWQSALHLRRVDRGRCTWRTCGFALNAILAFWIAYILTRPLGASIGDYLSQPRADGGLGLGTTRHERDLPAHDPGGGRLPHDHEARHDRGRARERGDRGSRSGSRPRRRQQDARDPGAGRGRTQRAAAGPAEFVMLVPNPAHLAFDRSRPDVHDGEEVLAKALPALEQAAGVEVEGRVASSPNAFDDIVAELSRRGYSEIILETLPAHVSHWLHVDLPQRLAHLGYPLTTVTATH